MKTDSSYILGYSTGRGIAFQMAVRHPEQVRRLVVLSGTYAHNGWWPDVETAFPPSMQISSKDLPSKDNMIAWGMIRPVFLNM